jgi:hypothetical protein
MHHHGEWIVKVLVCSAMPLTACGSSLAAGPQAKTVVQHEAVAAANACEGISAADREQGPFFHGAAISGVSQLPDPSYEPARLFTGATIAVRAAPGLTAEWLQRLAECDIARHAAMGFDMPDAATCPLAIPGIAATVVSSGDGFVVKVSSENDATAAEIWRRAQAIRAKS